MKPWTYVAQTSVIVSALAWLVGCASAPDGKVASIGAPVTQPENKGDFVGRSGTLFTLHGEPFYVAGSHTHYLAWGTPAEVDGALHDAKALNLNVVRFFITSFIGSLDKTTKPTIWAWPGAPDSANMDTKGVYTVFWDTKTNGIAFNDGPDGFQKIDYAIKKAGELGIRLNLAFMDFWQYAGGSQQMRAWYGSVGNLGRTGAEQSLSGPDERYDFFFRDARTKADYKKLVSYVLNRKNSLTGVVYKHDPTIFAWDLMNEPEVKSVDLAIEWKSEMAAFVKSIDQNHLLSAGNEGFYGGNAGNDPDRELAIEGIDFGTWHAYPAYHNITPGAVNDLIRRHAESAKKANKPVLLQEFGYSSLNPDQLQAYQGWLNTAYEEKDCAGWLHWRLTSKMADGKYPRDNGEHFDLNNDGGPLAKTISDAALRQRNKGKGSALR